MLPSRCAPALLVACSLAYAEGAFAARCPNMYIVLDKSGSMAESAKWTNAKAAIEAFTAGTVTVGSRQVPRQSTMRFGLMLYPSDNRCGAGTHQVSCDFYRSAEINAALARYSPGGATPTGEALEAANYSFLSAEVSMIPQNTVDATADAELVDKLNRMLDRFDDNDDVQEVYHNAALPDEE